MTPAREQAPEATRVKSPTLSAAVQHLVAVLFAGILCGLNAVKPVHIDDYAYLVQARQIVAHPLDPYGFSIFWVDKPEPASKILSMPLVPYWLAGGMTLFGERIWALKLWLFPFAYLLSYSLLQLSRRWAPGREVSTAAMILLSPVILPGINLMFDLPVLALGWFGVSLFLRSLDTGPSRRPLLVAGLAGIALGLAFETKFIALTSIAAVIAIGLWRRSVIQTAVAIGAATLVIAIVEGLLAWKYGASAFLQQLASQRYASLGTIEKSISLLQVLGGVCSPMLAWWGIGSRGRSWSSMAIGGGALLLFPLLLLLPESYVVRSQFLGLESFFSPPAEIQPWFLAIGLLWSGVLIRLCYAAITAKDGSSVNHDDAAALVMLVGMEAIGMWFLSPFVAVRRVQGLFVAGGLLFGWSMSREARSILFWPVTVVSVLFGGFIALCDIHDASMLRDVVGASEQIIEQQNRELGQSDSHRLWFLGHWGVQYYAEAEGLLPVVPGESRLQTGDWVMIPVGIARQEAKLPDDAFDLVLNIEPPSSYRTFRTTPYYYGGRMPFGPWDRPVLKVVLARCRRPFVPGE